MKYLVKDSCTLTPKHANYTYLHANTCTSGSHPSNLNHAQSPPDGCINIGKHFVWEVSILTTTFVCCSIHYYHACTRFHFTVQEFPDFSAFFPEVFTVEHYIPASTQNSLENFTSSGLDHIPIDREFFVTMQPSMSRPRSIEIYAEAEDDRYFMRTILPCLITDTSHCNYRICFINSRLY